MSRRHIDYLVTAVIALQDRLAPFQFTDKSPDELGRMLWRECLASVAYRYPDDSDGERPGPPGFRDADVGTYTYTPAPVLTDGALAKTLGCYRYQSCEHPGWNDSEAGKLTAALYNPNIPYDESAPWGW